MNREQLIDFDRKVIRVDILMRMKLAARALSTGVDIESVSKLLHWREFEELASIVLEKNGYVVKQNVRFKSGHSRMEIDVVGCREPIVVCVDCKHWQRTLPYLVLGRIVQAQKRRVKGLADSFPNPTLKVDCQKWNRGKFVPVILSLFSNECKFYEAVPVVPVLMFQDFVKELPANIMDVEQIEKSFHHLG